MVRKTLVGLFSLGLASALGAAAVSDVSSAGPAIDAYQADARIQKGSQAYIGNGIINDDGTGQTVGKTLEPGQVAEFKVRVRHAGVLVGADRFAAFDNIDPNELNFKVTYFFKDKNVTSKVASFDFKFGKAIQPNESTPALRIRVKAKNDAPGGSGGFAVITRSVTDGSVESRDEVGVDLVVTP